MGISLVLSNVTVRCARRIIPGRPVRVGKRVEHVPVASETSDRLSALWR
jgi:hypothetical protein